MIKAWNQLRRNVSTLAELAWPSACGACGAWGEALCDECSAAFAPRRVRPRPVWAGDLPTYSAAVFDGPVREVITAFKDEGRHDLAPPLSALLRSAVQQSRTDPSASDVDRWAGVLIPSSAASMRRRGRFPLRELVNFSEWGIVAGPQLQLRRVVQDQSRLSRQERRTNLEGALRVRPGGPALPSGCGLLLLDDVVTTGATLSAARQALAPLRPRTILAATIAART